MAKVTHQKVTFQHVMAACDDLSDAIGKLRESFTFDPVDKEVSHIASAVPDYVTKSAYWMKKISFEPEIEFNEPVEVINEAASNARLAIQEREPHAAVRAFKAAAGACYVFNDRVYSLFPEERRNEISAPPRHGQGVESILRRVEPGEGDVFGTQINANFNLSGADRFEGEPAAAERLGGDNPKKAPPPGKYSKNG